MRATNEIKHLIDGTEVLVRCIFIFLANELVCPIECTFPNKRNGAGFVHAQNGVEDIKKSSMRSKEVNLCDIIPLERPVNTIIVLDIKFFPQGENEFVLGHLEANPI